DAAARRELSRGDGAGADVEADGGYGAHDHGAAPPGAVPVPGGPPPAMAVRSNSGRNMLVATRPTTTPREIRISGSIRPVTDLIRTSFSSSRKSAMLLRTGPSWPVRSPFLMAWQTEASSRPPAEMAEERDSPLVRESWARWR